MDPDNLPAADKTKMNFGSGGNTPLKAWKDIWSAGQSVSGIRGTDPVGVLIDRMAAEYEAARARIRCG
jgi:nitronate monooxygenase